MEFDHYLETLLGADSARSLLKAIAAGKTIIISGPQGPTGKSTLCRVLKKRGVSAFEQMDVYEVDIPNPLQKPTPRMEDTISG